MQYQEFLSLMDSGSPYSFITKNAANCYLRLRRDGPRLKKKDYEKDESELPPLPNIDECYSEKTHAPFKTSLFYHHIDPVPIAFCGDKLEDAWRAVSFKAKLQEIYFEKSFTSILNVVITSAPIIRPTSGVNCKKCGTNLSCSTRGCRYNGHNR